MRTHSIIILFLILNVFLLIISVPDLFNLSFDLTHANKLNYAKNIGSHEYENFGLLNFSVGIGEGSQSGTLYGWNYLAPDSDFNGDPRPNPVGSNPDIGAIENSLAL